MADPVEIDSGSITIFRQSTTLVGWTRLVDVDDYTLRIVSGTAGSGGSESFSSVFTTYTPSGTVASPGSSTTDMTTLNTGHITPHTHTGATRLSIGPALRPYRATPAGGSLAVHYPSQNSTEQTNITGGDGHAHPLTVSVSGPGFTGNQLNFSIKYLDVMRAQRN